MVQIMCTSSGPGSADLAGRWASDFGLSGVQVWGDTTDHMFYTYIEGLGGSYPTTAVIELDTMKIRYFRTGSVETATAWVNEVLAEDHPCAE